MELGYHLEAVNLGSLIESYPFDYIAHNYSRQTDAEFILNLASQNPQIRDQSINYVLNALAFCEEHDIPTYSVHCGFRVDPTRHPVASVLG